MGLCSNGFPGATLDDPDALRTASESAATVLLTLPQGYPSKAVWRFGRNAIDAFEAQLTEMMGSEAGAMILEMYRRAEADLDSGLFERDAAKLRRSFPDFQLTPLKAWVEQQDWQQLAGTAQATEND